MNGIKKSFAKVILFLGFQVVICSLIFISQAMEFIDQDDLQSDKVMRAPMPGRLTRVNVKKGQEVEVGDLLYIIEAMKMEMTVCSPFAGQIQDVHFRANDIVVGNCTIISFTPPFVARTDMNQPPKRENKDISVTLATYATSAPSLGANLPGSRPSGTASTECSSHESFVIKPSAGETMQKERSVQSGLAQRLNYVFNGPADDVDSDSAPIKSPDKKANPRPLVDKRDYLIALFSYAKSPPPPGSFPPDSFSPGSSLKESPAKEMLRKSHDLTLENGKERSSLHAKPMSPMRELVINEYQVTSGDSSFTAIKWICGSIVMYLLMLTSKLVISYRLRRSQARVFNQIKNFHFADITPNRFLTNRRAINMNRVIFTKWKTG